MPQPTPSPKLRGFLFAVPGTIFGSLFMLARLDARLQLGVGANIPTWLGPIGIALVIASLIALPVVSFSYLRSPAPRPLGDTLGFCWTVLAMGITVGLLWVGV